VANVAERNIHRKIPPKQNSRDAAIRFAIELSDTRRKLKRRLRRRVFVAAPEFMS